MDIHLEAENKAAEFKGVESSLTIAGYTANVGLIPPLVQGKQDIIISDELNHGSIIDGVRLTKAQRARFSHNDMGAFEQVLRKIKMQKGSWSSLMECFPWMEISVLLMN